MLGRYSIVPKTQQTSPAAATAFILAKPGLGTHVSEFVGKFIDSGKIRYILRPACKYATYLCTPFRCLIISATSCFS